MREIERLEPVARGAYTGSLGYVSARGCDFNILIRSITFAAGNGYLSAGGGIVIESDPETEYLETRHKAEALLHVLGHGKEGEAPAAPRRADSWRPPRPRGVHPARVVFLENHDSFSYNIVNYLRMLGAEVAVLDQSEGPRFGGLPFIEDDRATHLIVGPGPGDPATAGCTVQWVEAALEAELPFLGVCLGHQALGVACGARLRRAPHPVHGEDHRMHHTGRGPFAGLPDPAPFTRYNSLVLDRLPSALTLEAWSAAVGGRVGEPEELESGRTGRGLAADPDGRLVMAVAHRDRPAWGVQFHPESMLSPYGLDLLANFLETGLG